MFNGPTIRIRIRIPFTLITAVLGAIAGLKYGEMNYHERRELKQRISRGFERQLESDGWINRGYYRVRNPASEAFWLLWSTPVRGFIAVRKLIDHLN